MRNGQATSMELLDACWANLEVANPRLNATIWLDREGAEQAARAADRAVREKAWLGPLHGVPLAHKDMYYQAGRLSTCGSAICKDWRPNVTATVIEKLHAAGAYEFGGLNMAEFAQIPTGHNRAFGDCHNPWIPPYITGGSSSGPALPSRRGSTMRHWVPTPADPSACRPLHAASPGSSRRRPACRASA